MILIIPDVHGRTFWKSTVENIDKYDKVIFLGDYLDPYGFENVEVSSAINNFESIIYFAKSYPSKVVLLLGNHDIYYWYKLVGPCRYAYRYAKVIEKIFEDNRDLFNVAYETEHTLFTHAGYINKWSEYCNSQYYAGVKPTAESLNYLLHTKERIRNEYNLGEFVLDMPSRSRGGYFDYGSILWADVREHLYDNNDIGKFQIFGHTLQLNTKKYDLTRNDNDIMDGEPIITDKFAMLDCRKAFEYDEETKTINLL